MKVTQETVNRNFDTFLEMADSHRWGELARMIKSGMKKRGDNRIPRNVWIVWLTNIVNFESVNDGQSVIRYLQGTRSEFTQLFLDVNAYPHLKDVLSR